MSDKCPKCGEEFMEVNGLYVKCKCGYLADSNFDQIMLIMEVKQ